MKNILLLLGLIMSTILFAQQTPSAEDYLTPDQKAQLSLDRELALLNAEKNAEIKLLNKKIEQYGDWVGVGGEIGQAINEGLSAVTDVASEFGKTEVGKFTMILIAWKVAGKDLSKFIGGLLLVIIGTIIIFKIFRSTYYPTKTLEKNPGFLRYPKEYKITEPNNDWEGYITVKVLLFPALLIILIAICGGIMF